MPHELRLTAASDPGAASRDYLNAALANPQQLASMPRIGGQLADGEQLARIMQSDPLLAGEALRVELFSAPGHEPECEDLWRESWYSAAWAREIARLRRREVEEAFLAALLHRTGAALALRLLARFEVERRTALDTRTLSELVAEFDARLARALMDAWRITPQIQAGAIDWRDYRLSSQSDLAATVHAAHVLAAHTMHPQLLVEEMVLESPVFEHLGLVVDQRKALLGLRESIRSPASVRASGGSP